MTKMTRQDWMAYAEAATQAATRFGAAAASHEAEARRSRDPWSKSVMMADKFRDDEARCKSAAKHAKEMACHVR